MPAIRPVDFTKDLLLSVDYEVEIKCFQENITVVFAVGNII